jgi:hypothetical protein
VFAHQQTAIDIIEQMDGALPTFRDKAHFLARPHPRARSFHSEHCERGPRRRRTAEDVPAAMSALTAQAPVSANPAIKQGKTLKISRVIRTAIEAMVWDGLTRAQAAEKAGIKDNSLYIALRRPDVKQHYLSELDVLRTSERARNIHRAVEIREQTTNQMASIQAIKLLEQISDDAPASRGSVSLPGLVIVVNTGAPLTQPPTIDADMKVISE